MATVNGAREAIRIALKVARTSGLLWEIRAAGLPPLVKSLLSRSPNPSAIYRIYAKNSPDKPAIVWNDQTLRFAELDARIDRMAAGLTARGLRRGSSIVVMMKNRPELVELCAAATRIGASAVAVSWRSTANELAYIANHCGANALAFDHDLWNVVEEARRELPAIADENLFTTGGARSGITRIEELGHASDGFVPEKGAEEDAAVVIYTSGTTGKPKGAVRKFPKNAVPAFLRFIAETPMRADDVHVVTCPLYHSTAFGFLTFTHVLGGTVVIMDEFKAERFLEIVERYQATTTALVPTMLHRVMQLGRETIEKYDTRSLRAIFSGGAPLPAPLALDVMDQFGDILFNFYGATETGMVTLAKPDDLRAAPGTIGRAVPGNEIRLFGDSGREVKDGDVGELYVKNDFLVEGYHRDEVATKESMKDGFFSVGDLARKDKNGRFFVEGRARDMIISGGVNVYPAEVEGVLEQHPGIAEVAVVGIPDAEWGERVRAFVAREHGSNVDGEALAMWARQHLAGPKVPRDFVFVEALPRNATGKVLKRELRKYGVG